MGCEDAESESLALPRESAAPLLSWRFAMALLARLRGGVVADDAAEGENVNAKSDHGVLVQRFAYKPLA